MSLLAVFAPLSAADVRNINEFGGPGSLSNVVDTDFLGGRAIQQTVANDGGKLWIEGTPTLAVGDEINYVGQVSAETGWTPNTGMSVWQIHSGWSYSGSGDTVTYPLYEMVIQDDATITINTWASAVSSVASASLYTMTLGTPVTYRNRIKRTATNTVEFELFINAVSKGTITHTSITVAAMKSLNLGLCTSAFGKSGSGTLRSGRGVLALNETPTLTNYDIAEVLVTGDGATLEWDTSTGTTHYTLIDDAIGSFSAADYTGISFETVAKDDDLTLGDISIAGRAIVCVIPFLGFDPLNPPVAGAECYIVLDLSAVEAEATVQPNAGIGGNSRGRLFLTDPNAAAWTQSSFNSTTLTTRKKATGGSISFLLGAVVVQVWHIAAVAASLVTPNRSSMRAMLVR